MPTTIDIGEEALEFLAASKDIGDVELEALARAALSVLLGAEREDTALVDPVLEEMNVDLIKKLYSGFVCLFVEAAKNDLSSKELCAFLRSECGVAQDRGELLSHLFANKKEELRTRLSLTANYSHLPQLSGVDWRLEYRTSSSSDEGGPVRELVYHLSLKTRERDDDGELRKLDFSCSVEQLQDLVSQLKDACKSVERAVERR